MNTTTSKYAGGKKLNVKVNDTCFSHYAYFLPSFAGYVKAADQMCSEAPFNLITTPLRVSMSGFDEQDMLAPTDLNRAGVLRVVQQPHSAVAFPVQTPDAAAHQSAQHLLDRLRTGPGRRARSTYIQVYLLSRQRRLCSLVQHLVSDSADRLRWGIVSSVCARMCVRERDTEGREGREGAEWSRHHTVRFFSQ